MPLIIGATPIGNSKDASIRLKEEICNADVILAEDTRVFGILAKRLNIVYSGKVISFYEQSEKSKIPKVLDALKNDERVLLVSDAGTPLIQDPGFNLINECINLGIEMTSLPGPSAFLDALVLSGKPPYPFTFYGFLPIKQGKRKKILEEVQKIGNTSIFYESPFRIEKTIEEIGEVFGSDFSFVVARELTKEYETIYRGNAITILQNIKPKGEFVIVL